MSKHARPPARWRWLAGLLTAGALLALLGYAAGHHGAHPAAPGPLTQCQVVTGGHHYTLAPGQQLTVPGAQVTCAHGTVGVTPTLAPAQHAPRLTAAIVHVLHWWHKLHMAHEAHMAWLARHGGGTGSA